MKTTHLLFPLLVVFLTFTLNAQENYHGFNHNTLALDYNNNGKIDNIAGINSNSEFNTITLWSDNSELTIELNVPDNLENPGKLTGKMVTGDFDNDGFIDDIAGVYEIGYNQTNIVVWLNKNGNYKAEKWWYGGDFDANQVAMTVVSGDFDNDGFVDDLAASYDYTDNKTNFFVWNSDSKKFNWPRVWWHGADFNSAKIQGKMVSGDFDHDGYMDDIAALYDYDDNYTKLFVWASTNHEFNWPYTWYQQANFYASNVKGNVVAGDFNHNGFVDNIAAFYMHNKQSSEIMVWERGPKGFNEPQTWWYGQNEGFNTNNRLVAFDGDGNGTINEIVGIEINNTLVSLSNWTANNREFTQPFISWEGITIGLEECNENGNCLSDWLNNNFDVFPNPSDGNLTLAIPKTTDEEVEVFVFNTIGQMVYNTKVESGKQLQINLSHIGSGNYIAQIIGVNTNYRSNLIIK